MKPIAICLAGVFLLLGPTPALSMDDEFDRDSSERAESGEERDEGEEMDDLDDLDDPDLDDHGFHWAINLEKRHRHHSIFALFRRHSDTEMSCTRVLDIPFFSLYRSMQEGDQSDRQFLRLPIIGSLYRHRVDGNYHRREFLYLIDIETES
jgi:hypothetical protein